MSRQYKNPPLVEAVCELRFDLGGAWDMAIPGLVYESLKGRFPARQPVKEFESSISVGSQGLQQQLTESERLQFVATDQAAMVQISPTVLAINQLKPYRGWDRFVPDIRLALDAFVKEAKPRGLRQIALRFINHVKFHEPKVDLEEYFDFFPSVGKHLPQDYSHFITGIKVLYENDRDLLQITMAGLPADKPGTVAIGIDLHYTLLMPDKIDIGQAFDWLDRAHGRIEDSFEGSIKDKLRDRFNTVEG